MALQEELEQQGIWLFKYRSYLPLIALVIGYILYLRTELYPNTFILEGTPYEGYFEFVCLLICAFGLVIRSYTVGHTPRLTSGRNTATQVAESLNTTGIYSIVRHPLYVGNFFMWLGPAMITGNLFFVIAFILFFWVYYERIMFAEEQFLRRKFKEEYTNWASRVPAFVPNFKDFKKAKYPFSWKKVLKKEKNGLAAMFLIFTLFDITGAVVDESNHLNYLLVSACIVTGIGYLVLKYLKKQTSILDEVGR